MFDQAAPLRIFIADQQPNVRQALWLVCEQGLGLTVVAEAANAPDLLARVKATQPDLIILEWGLPGTDSAELVSFIHAQLPAIIVGIGTRAEEKAAALLAGIDFFAYKGDPPASLLGTLQAAINIPRQAGQP
jgi:DNA-binding NarL/FixJ family response regulator